TLVCAFANEYTAKHAESKIFLIIFYFLVMINIQKITESPKNRITNKVINYKAPLFARLYIYLNVLIFQHSSERTMGYFLCLCKNYKVHSVRLANESHRKPDQSPSVQI